MDLLLMILRFLFGMPADAGEAEPILIHPDGRTSNRRKWRDTRWSVQIDLGASTTRQRLFHWGPGSSGFWERLSYYLRKEPRSRSRCQDDRRRSRV